jgi:predicted DNA-binding transcriptional regulator AlpA
MKEESRHPVGHERVKEIMELNAIGDSSCLLKVQEVAALLGKSVHTLNIYRSTGKGPKFLKIGRSCRYRLSDIMEFINSAGA